MLTSHPSQQIYAYSRPNYIKYTVNKLRSKNLLFSCMFHIERIERKIVHIGTEKSSRQINDVKLENFSFILIGDFRFAFYELCFLWGSTFLALSSDTQTLRET